MDDDCDDDAVFLHNITTKFQHEIESDQQLTDNKKMVPFFLFRVYLRAKKKEKRNINEICPIVTCDTSKSYLMRTKNAIDKHTHIIHTETYTYTHNWHELLLSPAYSISLCTFNTSIWYNGQWCNLSHKTMYLQFQMPFEQSRAEHKRFRRRTEIRVHIDTQEYITIKRTPLWM